MIEFREIGLSENVMEKKKVESRIKPKMLLRNNQNVCLFCFFFCIVFIVVGSGGLIRGNGGM